MKPIEVKRNTVRFINGNAEQTEDSIVTEYPFIIKLNGDEFVTMVCTPEYMEDMAIGFLASEGVIRKYEDIVDLWLQEKQGYIHVKTKKCDNFIQNLRSKRYITSCCGMSRQSFVFANDALTVKKIPWHYCKSIN